jgi:hypothetical protein
MGTALHLILPLLRTTCIRESITMCMQNPGQIESPTIGRAHPDIDAFLLSEYNP